MASRCKLESTAGTCVESTPRRTRKGAVRTGLSSESKRHRGSSENAAASCFTISGEICLSAGTKCESKRLGNFGKNKCTSTFPHFDIEFVSVIGHFMVLQERYLFLYWSRLSPKFLEHSRVPPSPLLNSKLSFLRESAV